MFTHGGARLEGLGDIFSFDPSNPFGTITPSTIDTAIEGSSSSSGDFFNSSLFSPNILTSSISAPTSIASSTPGWETQLTNLIPGLATTTEKILTTQFSVPQTSAGQFFSTNSKTGTTTTYTLPSNAGASLSLTNPFGTSLTSSGSLLPLLAIGALALLLFKK